MSLNFFRKIFNLDLSKKTTRKGIRRKLELLGLEERVVPATFTVINNSDLGAGSLRDAITLANTTAGDDTIDFNFASGTSPYTITLASALPSIVDASSTVGAGTAGTVTITGLGANSLTIDGSQGGFNIFRINTGGNLTISGVTVSGANISGNGLAFSNLGGNGGAFNNSGTLFVSNSTISGNTADSGGGIRTYGALTVSNSTISNNNASSYGGGICSDGSITVINSTISGNTASQTNSGTINTYDNGSQTYGAFYGSVGGGLYLNNGTATISNSTISGNTASFTNTGTLKVGNIYAGNGGGISIFNATVTLSNSTISGNSASFTNSGTLTNANFYLGYGGGIMFNQGTLNVTNSTISGNSASTVPGTVTPIFVGGGIYNRATLNIANTIIANSTDGASTPALIDDYDGTGTVNLTSPSTAANNLVSTGTFSWATTKTSAEINLGTLANNGGPTQTLALLSGSVAIGAGNATISNAAPLNGLDQRGINRTTSDIGAYSYGIQVTTTADAGAGSLRQAIDDANSTPGNDQISFNFTGSSSYTIALASALPNILDASTSGTLTITGLGASSLTIDANKGNFSIFTINTGGDLTISGVTVSRANISGNGGAFNNSGNLTISNSTLSGNFASNGGGIFNNVSGTATITNSTISGNSGGYGGGINNSGTLTVNNSTISGNSISNQGSGIYNNNNASLTVTNSTISGNSAGFAGGGIYNNTGILTLSNSTLTGNSAYLGGALYNRGGSTATVTNSTFSGNTATKLGGGGGIYNSDILNIANTIIANSTKGGDYNGGGTVNLISPSTAANNLVSSGSFSWATTKTSAEINLGPLANNGGPTKTIALGTGSVAIGAGDATISNAAPVNGLDQRGVTRSTTAPSIGAFEFYPATQVTLTTTAAGSASGSAFTTQPVITIRDSLGNPVNTTASVTMTVSGNGTTVGTTTVKAVNGVATFTNVGISGTAGTAYTLTFTSNGLTSATQSITPTFGTATQATLSTNAAGSASGSAFTTQPVITIKDAFGNTVTNSTASVTMTVSGNGTTVGTTTVNAVAGVATFTNVGISGTAGTAYTLTFTSSSLTTATQSITPTFGTATQATLSTNAAGSVSGSAFTTQPVIQIKDAFGNTVTNSTASVTMTVSGNGTTVGTTTVNAVAGVATFTDVGISGTAGTAYTLTFASASLTSATQSITPLGSANTPTFGTSTSTADGFTVQISNYDANFTYAGTATVGSVSISGTGLVTVTGLAANTSSTATITTTQTNFVSGSGQVTATSLAPTAPLVVGTPASTSSGGSSTVTLYDPVTGAEASTAVPFPGFSGPVKVVSGDFNGDGVAELIAGAGFGGGPAIAVLNSQTGEVMEAFFAFDPAFTGGVFVAVQDVNNDGILDIIASAGPGGGPEVRIFDGSTLNVLRSFYAYAVDFTGGVSVASTDFNNDGILDLVTGAGPGGAPHVKVFDGATNAIISQWYAYATDFTGGVFVAVGDIGNDGAFEVVTGAGAGGSPVVAVWDPNTGALLAQFMAYAEDFTGGVRVGINDGNSDGIADILTGAGPGGGPQVNVFNFPALDLLFSFYSGDPANTGGVFVS